MINLNQPTWDAWLANPAGPHAYVVDGVLTSVASGRPLPEPQRVITKAAPPELVAYTKPCETCGGPPPYTENFICDNPDCRDGYRRCPIVVPCACTICEMRVRETHPRVAVGSCRVTAILPIVEFIFGNEALTAGVQQLVVERPDTVCYWDGAGDIVPVSGVTADDIGRFAVIIRDVEAVQ